VLIQVFFVCARCLLSYSRTALPQRAGPGLNPRAPQPARSGPFLPQSWRFRACEPTTGANIWGCCKYDTSVIDRSGPHMPLGGDVAGVVISPSNTIAGLLAQRVRGCKRVRRRGNRKFSSAIVRVSPYFRQVLQCLYQLRCHLRIESRWNHYLYIVRDAIYHQYRLQKWRELHWCHLPKCS
jgi:hypothetical protein